MAVLYSLYIQNRSRQVHEFNYRLPSPPGAATRFEARVLVDRIEPQTERRIYQEAPLNVLRAIVGQHRLVGLVAIEEAVSSTRLCYRLIRPSIWRKRIAVWQRRRQRKRRDRERLATT